MSQITHREKYINNLLKLNNNISKTIATEIDEIFHDRGRSSADLEAALHDMIREAFASGASYKKENYLDGKSGLGN